MPEKNEYGNDSSGLEINWNDSANLKRGGKNLRSEQGDDADEVDATED